MQERSSVRRSTNLVLPCRVPAKLEKAILSDISLTGCRIELFDGTPQKGSTIIFEVSESDHLAGEIVWVRGSEAGVRFSHKLSAPVRSALDLN